MLFISPRTPFRVSTGCESLTMSWRHLERAPRFQLRKMAGPNRRVRHGAQVLGAFALWRRHLAFGVPEPSSRQRSYRHSACYRSIRLLRRGSPG